MSFTLELSLSLLSRLKPSLLPSTPRIQWSLPSLYLQTSKAESTSFLTDRPFNLLSPIAPYPSSFLRIVSLFNTIGVPKTDEIYMLPQLLSQKRHKVPFLFLNCLPTFFEVDSAHKVLSHCYGIVEIDHCVPCFGRNKDSFSWLLYKFH